MMFEGKLPLLATLSGPNPLDSEDRLLMNEMLDLSEDVAERLYRWVCRWAKVTANLSPVRRVRTVGVDEIPPS